MKLGVILRDIVVFVAVKRGGVPFISWLMSGHLSSLNEVKVRDGQSHLD